MPIPAPLLRLFRLTRREYLADFFITPPLTLALAAVSIHRDGFGWHWLLLAAAGWGAWTLYEYAVHRLSHHAPWLVDIHKLHHRDPRDHIALHPALTLGFYAATWALFGLRAAPFAIGFSVGYVGYAALHTAFHYAAIRQGHPLRPLKRHHFAHHKLGDRCFAVTWPLWDRMFGTAVR